MKSLWKENVVYKPTSSSALLLGISCLPLHFLQSLTLCMLSSTEFYLSKTQPSSSLCLFFLCTPNLHLLAYIYAMGIYLSNIHHQSSTVFCCVPSPYYTTPLLRLTRSFLTLFNPLHLPTCPCIILKHTMRFLIWASLAYSLLQLSLPFYGFSKPYTVLHSYFLHQMYSEVRGKRGRGEGTKVYRNEGLGEDTCEGTTNGQRKVMERNLLKNL